MNDVQRHLLALLQEIDEICRENGIVYYIDGGTALGAIRHRGFLPWDDDADIMLTRDNWEKFKKVMQNHPRPNRVLEDLHSNPEYTMVYGRYCDTSTTCILRTSMIDQFQSGLFIDFFILDPIPDTPESKKLYFDMLGGYCEYLNPYYYDEIVGANEWYDTFCKMGREKGKQAVIEFVEKHLFSFPDGEGMTYGFRYDNGHWIYPRDVVGTPRRVMVEGVMLPVAEKAEDYLRIHYGDHWNMIPAATEAETHNVVINLDVPYDTFKNTYMPQINRPAAVKNYRRLHTLRVQQRKANAQVDAYHYTTAAQMYAQLLNKRLEKQGESLKDMIARRDYAAVRSMLDNYFDMQLNRWFLFYRVLVPVQDAQLYAALYLMLTDGLFSKADKVLSLRLEQGAGTEELSQIACLIREIRRAVCCFEQGDLEEVLRISREMGTQHPDIPDFAENELRALGMQALEKQDAQMARDVLEKISAEPENIRKRDWVRAVQGMLMHRLDENDEQSTETLQSLMQESRDGLIRLAIMDFLAQ